MNRSHFGGILVFQLSFKMKQFPKQKVKHKKTPAEVDTLATGAEFGQ